MIRTLLSLAAAVLSAGCTMVAAPPKDLTPLDLALTRRCEDPATVPSRDLTEHEVAALWGRDRLALRDCGRRFAATVKIIEDRDRRLLGRK
jgi:hypothetical protein